MSFSIEHSMGYTICLTIRGLHHGVYTMGFSMQWPTPWDAPWKIMVYDMTSWHFPLCVEWSWGFPCALTINVPHQWSMTCTTEQPWKHRLVHSWNNPWDRPYRAYHERTYTTAYHMDGFVSRNTLWYMYHGANNGKCHGLLCGTCHG